MTPRTVYTAEQDAQIRKLWGENKVTRAIALEMGLSVNAVIGRSRRLRCPPRTSPINRRWHNVEVSERMLFSPEPLPAGHALSWGPISLGVKWPRKTWEQ